MIATPRNLMTLQQALEQHPGIHRAEVRPSRRPGAPLTAYLTPDQQSAPAVCRLLRLEAEGALAGQTICELPNGMAIVQQNQGETDGCYEEIFDYEVYLRHGVQVRPGDCIFDAGANIGMFSLFLAQRCQPLTIYAFEPMPLVFEKLRLNTTIQGVDACLFPVGLADAPGKAIFTFYPFVSVLSERFTPGVASEERQREVRATVRNFILEQHAGRIGQLGSKVDRYLDAILASKLRGVETECSLTTVSEVITQHGVERIDLLKVDVEKSEVRLLQGIQPHDWPKIQQVVLEVHEDDDEVDQIVDLLRQHGFVPVVEPDPIHHAPGLYLVFAVRSEQRPAPPASGQTLTDVYYGPRALLDDVRAFVARHLPEYAGILNYELCQTLPC